MVFLLLKNSIENESLEPADNELNKNIKPLFLFSDIPPDHNKFYNINTC